MTRPNHLPPGWAIAKLGELGLYHNGRGYKKTEWSESGVPIVRIQNLTGTSGSFNHFQGEIKPEQTASPGDLLISWAATLDAFIWNGPVAAVNQHIFKVDSFIDVRFHYYAVKYALSSLYAAAHGSGMVHVTRKHFDETEIPLPPIEEQRRIVAVLEERLSQLDQATGDVQALLEKLQALRDALLARFLPTREEGTVAIKEVANVGSGATPLKSNTSFYEGGTIPWITSADLNAGVISKARQFITEEALEKTAVKLWPAGTLLVAMYGEGQTRGRCARLDIAATTNQACAAIVLHDDGPLLSDFLHFFLDASYMRMRRLAAGGVQPNLSLGVIRDIAVPLRPIEEQAKLVASTRDALEDLSRVRQGLGVLVTRQAALRRALLAAAFNGRVVDQEPGDEPAELLLKRIAENRAATATAVRRSRARNVPLARGAISGPYVEESA